MKEKRGASRGIIKMKAMIFGRKKKNEK